MTYSLFLAPLTPFVCSYHNMQCKLHIGIINRHWLPEHIHNVCHIVLNTDWVITVILYTSQIFVINNMTQRNQLLIIKQRQWKGPPRFFLLSTYWICGLKVTKHKHQDWGTWKLWNHSFNLLTIAIIILKTFQLIEASVSVNRRLNLTTMRQQSYLQCFTVCLQWCKCNLAKNQQMICTV